MVDGNPFYPLGGEWLYMSGYSVREESETDKAFEAIKMIHGNTIAVDIYWDQIEPEKGKFDFINLDALLVKARRYGVKLILLWFATWKNGNMDFTPAWIKNDPKRFKRVISPTGNEIWVLSSHCQANLKADKEAFAALCKHIKAKDSVEHTVIGLQVENEPGILGSDRDYGPEAQVVFNSSVPVKLVIDIKKAGKGKVFDLWQNSGGKEFGTWSELFGCEAGEIMTAWSIASYIDGVAEAGKKNYDIPMFINVWVMEQRWWPLPGEAYPSGGAVTKVLDIYKWSTPHIDLIAPDNYHLDSKGFASICATYNRDDNPLFLIETNRGPNVFRAIADYNLTGYFASGLEWINPENGIVDPKSQTNVDICQCVAAAIPLLLKYQGTGKIHAVIEEENLYSQSLDFDGYMGQIQFGPVALPYRKKREIMGSTRGWGMVIQASRNEFYLVGDNYQLFLRPKPSVSKMRAPLLVAKSMSLLGHFIRVDEGHFDQNGEFVVECCRNGDLISLGLWVEPKIGVVRAVLSD
jgi:hypothetical protein